MDLNIVALNIPYPPDYGGMIDTYYRIKALHDIGVRIHLHCFEYGRKHSMELESLCETTIYYPRESGFLKQFSSIPFVVSSRRSASLLNNLIKNDYPILFDGLHTTYYINSPSISGRKKLVRLHNIEHNYYHSLADNEQNFLKKAYFLIESAKLKAYEKILENVDYVLPISEGEHEYFNSKFQNSFYIAPFHPFSESESLTGRGDYIIFHGDLSVNENSTVAGKLISDIFSRVPYKCIIAGKDPPEFINSRACHYPNILVIPNPDKEQMLKLIVDAQINILPALASNGFKLKILFALYAGRHCIVNSIPGADNIIRSLCHVADSDEEMVSLIHLLMKQPYTGEMNLERRRMLSEKFDVLKNAKKLAEIIYHDSSP